ncbi:MAG: hypothetical protein IKF96_08740 [Eggerthellaceae bacterium]|nr:hypothetical protein [Eggerthellaceae bacterium]
MKRFAKIVAVIAALACAAALVCALGGCSKKEDPYAAAGTYKLVEIEAGSNSMTREANAMLDQLGLGTSLELRSDDTGTFILVGVPAEITWEGHTVTLAGNPQEFKLEGNVLSMTSESGVMYFEKQ